MTSPDTEFISILGASTAGSSDTTISRAGGKSLPSVLPILGLSDIVIFPGMVAPLLVESAASIRLIDDVVAGDRFLGLILQKKADIENPLPADFINGRQVYSARVVRAIAQQHHRAHRQAGSLTGNLLQRFTKVCRLRGCRHLFGLFNPFHSCPGPVQSHLKLLRQILQHSAV